MQHRETPAGHNNPISRVFQRCTKGSSDISSLGLQSSISDTCWEASITGMAEHNLLLVKGLSMEVWPWWPHLEPLLQPLHPSDCKSQYSIKGLEA